MSQTSNTRTFSAIIPSQTIFLTGATGILGAYLMKELLESTTSDLYCLVRAENPERGAERLKSILSIYEPEGRLNEEFKRRVHPVLGDIIDDNLGLSAEDYSELQQRIDTTIHVAALTNLFTTYRRIAPINLGGTRNIIRFCLGTRHKYLCHISTHTVVGDKTFDKTIVFKETDLDIGQGFDHMSYQQTKFEAEKLVRAAAADGLTWNILRPGQIFGDAKTGRYPHGQANITGLFYDIFKTVTETKVALHCHTHFDVVPVDYVSRGVVELGLRHNSYFETYHLTNPDTKTYSEVIGIIKELGYDIDVVSQAEYRRLLFAKEVKCNGVEYKSPTVSAFRWWYKRDIDFTYSAVTNCDYTQSALEARGVYCPLVDQDLIGLYFAGGLEHGYFAKAPKSFSQSVSQRQAEAVKEEVPL